MTYISAEVGINHNADIKTALDLIDVAHEAGCDAVKFQKRNPILSVPQEYKNVSRETPWGLISYYEYREKMEFGKEEFDIIDQYCSEKDIDWYASIWDLDSLEFMIGYDVPYLKIPSAMLTNDDLLNECLLSNRQVILSTGMSTMEEIEHAVDLLEYSCILMHSTSTYPCPVDELNLLMIETLYDRFGIQTGYSGHEVGLATTVAAVAMGATYIERHITLDRSMWGSDQSASVEPQGLRKLVRDIRSIEVAMGDGIKKVYDSEKAAKERLRGIQREVKDNLYCG